MDFAGSILEVAILLVVEIVKARRALLDSPQKLLALVDEAAHAQSLLNLCHADFCDAEPFHSCLHDLGVLLLCTQLKIDKYRQHAVQPKCAVLEIAKSFFGQGAARQNLTSEALRDRIRILLDHLNQLLTARTGCQVSSLSEVVELSHSVNMNTNDKVTVLTETVSILQGAIDDTKSTVMTLATTLTQHTISPRATPVEVPDLISKLNELARESLYNEECNIDLEIADINSNTYHPPLEERDHSMPSGTADGNQRAAEKGGFKIVNRTSVRFKIGVVENRYFYVIMYDALEEKDPSLYFPEYASDKNEVKCNSKRRFPDSTKFPCDPVHMVITKSTCLGADAVGRHNLYIVLTRNKLHSDTKKQLQVMDIEDNIDDEDFVKHIVFDIQ